MGLTWAWKTQFQTVDRRLKEAGHVVGVSELRCRICMATCCPCSTAGRATCSCCVGGLRCARGVLYNLQHVAVSRNWGYFHWGCPHNQSPTFGVSSRAPVFLETSTGGFQHDPHEQGSHGLSTTSLDWSLPRTSRSPKIARGLSHQ